MHVNTKKLLQLISSATASSLQTLNQQATEAKCSHLEVESLPLENHSSVAQSK